ncbi:MAG: hypothetical protein PUP91_38365 [Rhizonema sp. PD37]|nr:hypothetical protein [Rhizonema sp. PD37]
MIFCVAGSSQLYPVLQHYQRIVAALKKTIEFMSQIDEAIPDFPIEQRSNLI